MKNIYRILALLLLVHGVSNATVRYVDSAATGANNGSSWANAYKYLSDAISVANAAATSDTIYIAKGTYYPTGLQTGTNRDSTFLITRGGIKIYGGYPTGGGTCNITANPTILSGDINTTGTATDNSYHVMVIAGVATAADSTVVYGITVTAGNNANSSGSFVYGADYIYRNNGAGMYVAPNNGNTMMAFRNCTFWGNNAYNGGGMYNDFATLTLTNCTFSGNTAGYGGGVYNGVSSVATITNCTFSGNSKYFNASQGGGIYNGGQSSSTIVNCIFSGNYTGVGGGMASYNCSPTLRNCTFSGNTADYGGAMYNLYSSPTITNSIIWGNSSGINNVGGNNTPVITYSLVQGISTGTGNINGNTNPMFINPQPASAVPTTAGDYRLLPCSPAINTGSNTAIPAGVTTDIAGNARIQLGVADMGAYEAANNSADTSASLASTTAATTKPQSGTQIYAQDCSNLIATLASINPVPASGSITAKVYVDATAPAYNGQRYVRRHYDITPADTTVANTGTATITLYFTQADFDNYNTNRGTMPALPAGSGDAAGIANFRITQQHGTSSTGAPGSFTGWSGIGPANVLITPTLAWNAIRSRWEATFPVTGFSGFFASGNTSTPLPLTLLSFTGTLLDKTVQLNWQTANELGTGHFDVEKSTDGSRFTAFSSVTAMGSGDNKYYTIDRQLQTGDNFYRLKIVDKGGAFTYGQVIKIRMADAANAITMSVYPNPAKSELFVNCNGNDEAATISIYSIDGRMLQLKAITSAGLHSFDIAALAEGVYVIIYQTAFTKLTSYFSKIN